MQRLRVHPGLWFFWIVIGWIYVTNAEGRYFPAASPVSWITSFPTTAPDPVSFDWKQISQDGSFTAIWIESARLRPECSFVDFDWRLGKRGGQNVPVTIRPGPPLVRANGQFFAGPWILWVEHHQFHKTFADVVHRCRFFGIEMPWVVKSRFWR